MVDKKKHNSHDDLLYNGYEIMVVDLRNKVSLLKYSKCELDEVEEDSLAYLLNLQNFVIFYRKLSSVSLKEGWWKKKPVGMQ